MFIAPLPELAVLAKDLSSSGAGERGQTGIDIQVARIGKVAMANAAHKLGMRAVVISSGREAVSRALAEARRVLEVRKHEKRRTQQLKAILDFTYDGVIALDELGRISVFNPVVEKLLGWPAEKAIGRFVSEVLPKAHFQSLLQTLLWWAMPVWWGNVGRRRKKVRTFAVNWGPWSSV